jgi:hypothetical protein
VQSRYGGHTVAQAVSRRLPTAAARVRARSRVMWDLWRTKVTGAGFLRVLRFPLPLIPLTASHPSSGAGILGQIVGPVIVDRVLLQPQKEERKAYTKFQRLSLLQSVASKWAVTQLQLSHLFQRSITRHFVRTATVRSGCQDKQNLSFH